MHIERYDLDILRSAAILGANASGKSTLVAALDFMKSAVADSQRVWKPEGGIPRVAFALDSATTDAPSLFVVDLLLDGIRYEYGFSVDSSRVLEEWLFAYPKGRKQEWFTRDASRNEEFAFSRLLAGENRTIAGFTRPNSLFLSAAAQNNHAMLAPVFRWFAVSLFIVDDSSRTTLGLAASQLCMMEPWRGSILELLGAADLGITDVEVIEEDVASFAGRMNRNAFDPELMALLPLYPRAAAGVRLRHRAGLESEDVGIPFDQESGGTKTLFLLAGPIVVALSGGGTLVVDELDRSLHPHLAIRIVTMFNDPATNPNNAQLIFNTHDTNLLDTSILRRDQIWFTEKGDDGATRLFPLTDFRARKYENLERGYLQGRYGAVPSIRTPDLRRVAAG
ncbi:hypothetical protein SAMN05216486_10523 [bacterium JGI 053]|nr:hypothetical protein SAMN05216486_10523 [bacterium JGI 053]